MFEGIRFAVNLDLMSRLRNSHKPEINSAGCVPVSGEREGHLIQVRVRP